MGVIDSQWWSLWWPWMAVWLLTAACVAVLVRHVLVRFGLLRRRRRPRRTFHGICFYLHSQRVMDIYLTGGFSAALEQEVAYRTSDTRGFGLLSKFGFGEGKVHGEATRERTTTYLEQKEPITVIGLLLDTMRKEDVVVDADLTTGLLVPNRTLGDRLRDSADDHVPLTAVMSEFLSVTGSFTARTSTGGDVVLRARYGTGDPSAHVKITCAASGVREEFKDEDYYSGEFQARCLGKVRTWNREAGELTVDAVAIFR
ncbi:hypothetical protein [Streptomyces sp. NPDC058614]|uniref:hypothetical protein n=1 Tax=Streptomyces sp. NPDC058614 TaxID=3346557 RepID=UPI003658EC66